MSFTLQGGPSEASLTRLENALVLVREAPPDEAEWGPAVQRAGRIFGVAVSQLRTAGNAAILGEKVKDVAASAATEARAYATALRDRLRQLDVAERDSSRLQTARAASSLLDAIAQADPRAVVTILAEAEIPTSERAVGECVRGARAWAESLQGDFWSLVSRVAGLAGDIRERARPILDDVRQALTHDAHVSAAALQEVISTATPRLLDVLVPQAAPSAPPQPAPQPATVPQPTPQAPARPGGRPTVPAEGREERLSPSSAADRIAAIQAAHPDAEIEVSIHWKRKDA